VQRTGDGRTGRVLDSRAIERSGGAVCSLHRARRDEERRFLGESQDQGRRFVSGLASKPMAMVCQWFGLKTIGTVFSDLALKSVVMVSHRFGPQNRWR
jgi:hypothetical protein